MDASRKVSYAELPLVGSLMIQIFGVSIRKTSCIIPRFLSAFFSILLGISLIINILLYLKITIFLASRPVRPLSFRTLVRMKLECTKFR